MVICEICSCDMHLDQVYYTYTHASHGKLVEACEECFTKIMLDNDKVQVPCDGEEETNE